MVNRSLYPSSCSDERIRVCWEEREEEGKRCVFVREAGGQEE